MTELINTVQLQEIGDTLVELFELTLLSGSVYHLHNGLVNGNESIYFANKAGTAKNEYIAIPISIEGFEQSSDGTANRPSLTMANIPTLTRSVLSNEDTMLDILQEGGFSTNKELIGTTIEYRRTLFKYTLSSSEAAALPIEFPSFKYVLDRVSSETSTTVEFELANPMDLEGFVLPSRVVVGRYCAWQYQGVELERNGLTPKEGGGCSWPLDSLGRFFDVNDNIITKDISTIAAFNAGSTYTYVDENTPVRVKTTTNSHTKIWRLIQTAPAGKDPETSPEYWYREDVCGKLIESCRLRFQGNNTDTNKNASRPLPFGGFPGTKKFR